MKEHLQGIACAAPMLSAGLWPQHVCIQHCSSCMFTIPVSLLVVSVGNAQNPWPNAHLSSNQAAFVGASVLPGQLHSRPAEPYAGNSHIIDQPAAP